MVPVPAYFCYVRKSRAEGETVTSSFIIFHAQISRENMVCCERETFPAQPFYREKYYDDVTVSSPPAHCKDTVPKIGKNIPRKETARPQSQFLHSYICERIIYSHDRSAYLAAAK
jgi:hypothetical protein